MSERLKEYKEKRDFKITKEPHGQIVKNKKKLRFVVQHHLASRDHYDFRLEWEGTLKSWAIPKGPSLNPEDKRLAVAVEDHPYEYRNFEGLIPKGSYGGGTVMIWDEGVWEPVLGGKTDFETGPIKFTLEGKRLKGGFMLICMTDNNWLFIKEKDKYSKKNSGITKYKTSIRSGKTMREIENEKE